MSRFNKREANVENEDLLQAVLVVDDFEEVFADFTEQLSSALIPLANFKVIDYSLEWLGRCGFQETILFCSSHAQVIKDHLKKSPWSQPSSKMKITLIVSENCRSLGDALRDIDNKAIIKGNFALLSTFTVTNLNLIDILKHHKQICGKDKGAAMTMVLQDVGCRNPKLSNSTYVLNAATNRLLMHVKSSLLKKFEVPLEYLVDQVNLNICSNLIDTGVAICSPSTPLLFSDNFDFQTKEDFIRGLLMNEEILDSRIYCCQVGNGYGATVRDWQSFQRVTLDCIHRWTFPLVPDQTFTNQDPFSYYRNCIYKQPGVQLFNSVKLEKDVMIASNTQIGHNTSILRSVIGKNCSIGQNVTIRDSYIFDNSVIEDNCKIILSVVGENSKIKENSELLKCFLKRNVSLKSNSHVEEVTLRNEPLGENWEKLCEKAFFLKRKTGREDGGICQEDDSDPTPTSWFVNPEASYPESDYEEDEISSASTCTQSPEPDDTQEKPITGTPGTVFYSEVVDSLQRGFEEKLSCENLILEINSSRYAYNVSLSDVTVLTLKGILLLPPRVGSNPKELLTYFLPLLKNYIKTSQSQMECLELIEDIWENLGNNVAKCLHFLYDCDIMSEDSILKWHGQLEKESPLAKKVAPLIKWFEEAAEESSEESD